MKSVWKYEVDVTEATTIEMPKGARIVHVAHQRNVDHILTFWAEVNLAAHLESRRFIAAGTGHRIPDDARYVGTDCVNPMLVWHLYEVEL